MDAIIWISTGEKKLITIVSKLQTRKYLERYCSKHFPRSTHRDAAYAAATQQALIKFSA